MKHLKTALYLGAAAGIAGTGITRTADPALAKKPEEKLNTTTTAKAGGDGLGDGAAKVTQMQQGNTGQVKQAGDGAADADIEVKSVAPGADVAVAKQV